MLPCTLPSISQKCTHSGTKTPYRDQHRKQYPKQHPICSVPMTAVAALSLGLASALGASGGAGVGGEASSGVVRVPLAKRRRALAPQWGRAQSTVERPEGTPPFEVVKRFS